MTFATITFVLGVITVCTFFMQGKQWPTAITAMLLGVFIGTTEVGATIRTTVVDFFQWIIGWWS